jgi:hypothetical protein
VWSLGWDLLWIEWCETGVWPYFFASRRIVARLLLAMAVGLFGPVACLLFPFAFPPLPSPSPHILSRQAPRWSGARFMGGASPRPMSGSSVKRLGGWQRDLFFVSPFP